MKVKNIIKLTKHILGDSSVIFTEGLLIEIDRREFEVVKIKASNKDYSEEEVHYTIDLHFKLEEQIRNLIDMIDELNFHHDRLKRLRKVNNQQA